MNCYFCDTILKKKTVYRIRNNMKKLLIDENLKKESCFYIYELGKKSCIECGNNYYNCKYSKNKLNFISRRELGLKTKFIKTKNIEEYKSEHCFTCDKIIKNINIYTPINSRSCYIVGVGQFCSDCYLNFS